MTRIEEMAEFVVRADYGSLSEQARLQLRIRVLDALGCAIGALDGRPTRQIREQVEELGEGGACTLIGGGFAAPDRAALLNGALVRYLDFNDIYFARHETCHPSDNLGAILAATELVGGTGRELLTALAVAYQVQCRLSDEAPVRAKGFDHATQGAYAAAAGISRALRLDRERTANVLAICGTALNALRVTRTGRLSSWKGLAYPFMAACCVNAAMLAKHGITGPLEVIEGDKGFMASISGPFELDWSKEDLEKVRDTAIKKYNSESHSQTAVEIILQLRAAGLRASDVERIELEVFDVAHRIIGGGEEQADHSLPYVVAVALLDGEVMPPQYAEERIRRGDVQALLRRVYVHPSGDLSARFPRALPCLVEVVLTDGERLVQALDDYPGFTTRPFAWEDALRKFDRLCAPHAGRALRRAISETVENLEDEPIERLTQLLAQARPESERRAEGGEGWPRETHP